MPIKKNPKILKIVFLLILSFKNGTLTIARLLPIQISFYYSQKIKSIKPSIIIPPVEWKVEVKSSEDLFFLDCLSDRHGPLLFGRFSPTDEDRGQTDETS